MKQIHKIIALLIMVAAFFACSNNHNSVKNLSSVTLENGVGYLSYNFRIAKDYYCEGSVTNLINNKTYQIRFNNPEQPTNTINILGLGIYKKRVGEPVTI